MDWQAWVTATLVLSTLGLMATGRFSPDIVMMGNVVVLLVTGILTPRAALGGFANPSLITVALLYVVAAGLKETGAMDILVGRLVGRPRSELEAQARLAGVGGGFSAFINNTPLIAAMLPVVSGLCRRTGFAPSRLLLPLSFASILGGVCTLIGTSTNLVVKGLIDQHNEASPTRRVETLGFLTLTPVGLVIAAVGLAYIVLLGRRLLPERGERSGPGDRARQFSTALRVAASSPVAGKSIEAAGLRSLRGLFLSRVERQNETFIAVSPREVILPGDVLVFVGDVDSIAEIQRIKGLEPVLGEEVASRDRPNRKLIEAVVAPASPLIGVNVRDAGIRTRYGAVVVAVHRYGHRMKGKLGDVVLRAGDTILLEADAAFAVRARRSTDFTLVSELEGWATLRHDRAWVSLAIFLGLIGALIFNAVPTVTLAAVAAALMILTRCCTGPQARAAVDWTVVITIGASFALGQAIRDTGLAGTLVGHATGAVGLGAPWLLLGCIYGLTLLFTTFISNNAAAVLMFPIAVALAERAEVSFLPFAVAICFAASLEFATPLGYQTNLMVSGPGGYRFMDHVRFGGPLTLLCAVLAVALIPIFFPFHAG